MLHHNCMRRGIREYYCYNWHTTAGSSMRVLLLERCNAQLCNLYIAECTGFTFIKERCCWQATQCRTPLEISPYQKLPLLTTDANVFLAAKKSADPMPPLLHVSWMCHHHPFHQHLNIWITFRQFFCEVTLQVAKPIIARPVSRILLSVSVLIARRNGWSYK